MAQSAGPELAQLRGTRGRVLALLSNAVYLRNESGHILGLAGQTAEDGPITLRVAEVDLLLQLLKGRENSVFVCTEESIELQGIARLGLANARYWQARPPTAIAEGSNRLGAVMALLSMLEGSWCSRGTCGLAMYLYETHRSLPLPTEVPLLRANSITGDMLLRKLADRITEFQAAACELEPQDASMAMIGLLGLGIGLTPSGDDIVAGILASFVWQARLGTIPADFTRHLVEAIRAAAPGRTNDISVRLLWHAGSGLLYAPAMQLGTALLSGDPASIAEPARRLLSIGHSSGVDLAVGLLAGTVAGIEIESRSKVPNY